MLFRSIYAKSYLDLCALMFILYHKQLSLAKQQLDPSHEELRREGFLAAWEYTLDQRGKWNGVIRWWPGPKWFQDQNLHRAQRDIVEQSTGAVALLEQNGRNYTLSGRIPVDFEHAESSKEEAKSHSSRVKEFYARQGHVRVSKEKIEKEVKVLESLEQEGFAPSEIESAMSWLLQNRHKFGGEIHSLKLLTETIGQSLNETEKALRAKEQTNRLVRQRVEDRPNEQTNKEREMSLDNLSAAEKEELQERAVASLLLQGHKMEVVRELKSLVRCEMLKLVDERLKVDSQ